MVFSTREPKAASLEFVNLIRATCNKPPLKRLPKGTRKSACDCPIARALKTIDDQVDVDDDVIMFWDEAVVARLHAQFGRRRINSQGLLTPPVVVVRFINNFDRGKYPELERQ